MQRRMSMFRDLFGFKEVSQISPVGDECTIRAQANLGPNFESLGGKNVTFWSDPAAKVSSPSETPSSAASAPTSTAPITPASP